MLFLSYFPLFVYSINELRNKEYRIPEFIIRESFVEQIKNLSMAFENKFFTTKSTEFYQKIKIKMIVDHLSLIGKNNIPDEGFERVSAKLIAEVQNLLDELILAINESEIQYGEILIKFDKIMTIWEEVMDTAIGISN